MVLFVIHKMAQRNSVTCPRDEDTPVIFLYAKQKGDIFGCKRIQNIVSRITMISKKP